MSDLKQGEPGWKPTPEELREIVRLNKMWQFGAEGGQLADLSWANLRDADLIDANLIDAELFGADLTGADLTGAVLSWANLREADLTNADLTGADLTNADLIDADLFGADLTGADLFGAKMAGANLGGANLVRVVGNMSEIKSLMLDRYPIAYTVDRLQIGCKNHALAEWWGFSDDEIDAMDDLSPLDWWRKWKPILQWIISDSPCLSTNAEGEA